MNLSKDELVKLASGIKINKRILEKKSKNELVEFITGITVDKCSPKQVKSALKKAYECSQAKRIELDIRDGRIVERPRYPQVRYPESLYPRDPPRDDPFPQIPVPVPDAEGRLPPIPPINMGGGVNIAPLEEFVRQLETNLRETERLLKIDQANLEAELVRHEAKSVADHTATNESVANVYTAVGQVVASINDLQQRDNVLQQRVVAIFEQERANMVEVNRADTRRIVVDTVANLVDDTVTRVASQLNRETSEAIDVSARAAAQKAVDAVIRDTLKVSSAVQTAMDQRVSSVIQENLGDVKQSLLEVRTSLASLQTLSGQVDSLIQNTGTLRNQVQDRTDSLGLQLDTINTDRLLDVEQIDTRIEDLKLALNTTFGLTQQQVQNATVYVDSEILRLQRDSMLAITNGISSYDAERQRIDQSLTLQINAVDSTSNANVEQLRAVINSINSRIDTEFPNIVSSFVEVNEALENFRVRQESGSLPLGFDFEAFQRAATENLLKRMRDYIRDNVTQRQIDQDARMSDAEKSIGAIVDSVNVLRQRPALEFDREAFSRAATEDILQRMREYVVQQFGNRQLTFETQLNNALPVISEIQQENEQLSRRLDDETTSTKSNLQMIVATTNQTQQNISTLVTQVSTNTNDISSINEDVARAVNDSRTAMSLIPTVNQLAIELPQLKLRVEEPLIIIDRLTAKLGQLETNEVKLSREFVTLNNNLRTQRDNINERLQANASAIDEVRLLAQTVNLQTAAEIRNIMDSNRQNPLAIEPSPTDDVRVANLEMTVNQQRQMMATLEERLSDLESELRVATDARIKQLQTAIAILQRETGVSPTKRKRPSPPR